MTTWAEYFGAVFPAAGQVLAGVEYGPTGDDSTGTAVQYVGDIAVTIDSDATGTGWPTTLRVGDAYTADNGRAFRITITDASGTVLTSLGGNAFGDAADEAVYRFDWLTTPGSSADFVGALTWVPAAGEETAHYLLQIVNTETSKAVAHRQYRGQMILWPGDANKEVTLDEWCVEATAKTTA